MLDEIYPRVHSRFSSLPLLGPHAEGFAVWLYARGYPRISIRRRIRALPRVDDSLRRRGTRGIEDLEAADLLGLAPRDSRDDIYLSAVVRSLASYFAAQDLLRCSAPSPPQALVGAYRTHLQHVRGFAEWTLKHHSATATELLTFVGFDGDLARLGAVGLRDIEAFLRTLGSRLSRASLQHSVAHLRSFLRFLADGGFVDSGLHAEIDTPRTYRGELLPRSLPWETVRALLASIDRSTPMGKRDYAMLLLVATYGLRTSEVVAIRLGDVEWRAGRLRVPRPKTGEPLILPLTDEVGAALVEYLREGRPDLPRREVFLRVRTPPGPLKPTAVTEAFQACSRRSGLSIPFQGPHCLRHSLAVHLLRQGTSLATIGDLLGHRSPESTVVYLRLDVEDLRQVSLPLPHQEVQT